MTGRTKKRIAQSKRVRAGSLAIVDQPRVARTCILRAFGLQTSCRLSLVLRVFCFRILAFTDAAALFVQSVFVLRYTCAPTATRSYLTTVCVLFLFLFLPFLFLWRCSSTFCAISVFSLYGEYVVRFLLPGGVFLPCDHGLDVLHFSLCGNSLDQSINQY